MRAAGLGAGIERGEYDLESLSDVALQHSGPLPTSSGRQEMLENLINEFI